MGPSKAEKCVLQLPNQQCSWLDRKRLESLCLYFSDMPEIWAEAMRPTAPMLKHKDGQWLHQQGSHPQRVCG